MKYALSIDWLALYCYSEDGSINTQCEPWDYEKAPHGTRQFKELIYVRRGLEDFAEVQQIPCSSVLKSGTLLVKFCNRWLYHVNLWHMVSEFLERQHLQVLNISRLDIAADFNYFHNKLHPLSLIRGFLNSTYRHIGRGIGGAFFNHGAKREKGCSKSFLNYTGLRFGQRSSDACVYLYDKSFELITQEDKPHIRTLWNNVGLINTADVHVWRLEVSIKSKGMQFKNKQTKERESITIDRLSIDEQVVILYHTFIKSLFSFIRNRPNINNVSREPRIQLFNGEPHITRAILKATDTGNRATRILIKSLWQLSKRYRGYELIEDEGVSKQLAMELAQSADLENWLSKKSLTWGNPKII